MTYCFKCPECGYRVEQAVRDPAPTHFHSWKPLASKFPQPNREIRMIRDYQAESVGIDRTSLRSERAGIKHEKIEP